MLCAPCSVRHALCAVHGAPTPLPSFSPLPSQVKLAEASNPAEPLPDAQRKRRAGILPLGAAEGAGGAQGGGKGQGTEKSQLWKKVSNYAGINAGPLRVDMPRRWREARAAREQRVLSGEAEEVPLEFGVPVQASLAQDEYKYFSFKVDDPK